MMEKRFIEILDKRVEIIANTDCTIAGSRNGHSALFLDYIINEKGHTGFKKDIITCIDNADYLTRRLNERGHGAWRNQNSITVVFNRPAEDMVRKWQLASAQGLSHVVVLPHVTRPKIHRFMRDMGGVRKLL